jgi:hypothetical protein
MRTFITRRRIETAEVDGALNIQLHPGFGTPKAAIVYSMTNSGANNANALNPTSPCMGVGFMASVTGAVGFTTRSSGWITDRVDGPPTEKYFWTDGTCAHDANSAGTITRKWLASGFGTDIIFGSLVEVGTQNAPLDLIIIAFTGDDFTAAVGTMTLSNSINGTAAVTNLSFAPDAVLLLNQPSTTNLSANATLSFGGATKAWSGFGVSGQGHLSFEFQNASDPTALRSRISNTRIASYTGTSHTAELTGFSGVGFTITSRVAASGANTTYFLAMKAKSPTDFYADGFRTYGVAVGNTSLPLPFNPQLVIGSLSADNAFDALDTSDDGATFNLFAGTGHSTKKHNGIGTITSSTGSATITGTGTSFRQQISIGDNIYNSSNTFIGTVSAIGSETSITLAANGAVTQSPSAAYYYDKSMQWNLNFMADDDNGSNSANRTRIGTQLFYNATAATPTQRVIGQMQNFDSTNSLPYVTTTNTGSRFGWIMAFANNEGGNGYRRAIEDIN